MPLDSDIAILGTGVAPLVAANHLLIQGKSVLLLNPDLDFFLEDSEFSLDPLLPDIPSAERLARNSPEQALEILRPDYPGAIEFWSGTGSSSGIGNGNTAHAPGFHDPEAPHVRQRGRLWLSWQDKDRFWDWDSLENLYVEASDLDLNPQILDDLSAARKFPGFSGQSGNFKGLSIPKFYDVDIVRYRNGLLEFVRERLGQEKLVCAASQIEWMPEGIRFHTKGSIQTAKLREGMLVFWTPKLSPWIIHQAKKVEITPKLPRGIRIWEQWSLNSRDVPDPNIVGMFSNMAVWADFEGPPPLLQSDKSSFKNPSQSPQLAVLRAGPLIALDGIHLPEGGLSWSSADSLSSLSHLCYGFLKWDRFSIRALRARAVFEWPQEDSWLLSHANPQVRIVPGCDGPLVDVVRVARTACGYFT